MVGIMIHKFRCKDCGQWRNWEKHYCATVSPDCTFEISIGKKPPPAIKSQKIHNEERADDLITALWRNGIGSKVEWAMELADLLEVLE